MGIIEFNRGKFVGHSERARREREGERERGGGGGRENEKYKHWEDTTNLVVKIVFL